MIEAYNKGIDLYSFMAAHVFSLVASKLCESLNFGLTKSQQYSSMASEKVNP
jgi:hypothetical protein